MRESLANEVTAVQGCQSPGPSASECRRRYHRATHAQRPAHRQKAFQQLKSCAMSVAAEVIGEYPPDNSNAKGQYRHTAIWHMMQQDRGVIRAYSALARASLTAFNAVKQLPDIAAWTGVGLLVGFISRRLSSTTLLPSLNMAISSRGCRAGEPPHEMVSLHITMTVTAADIDGMSDVPWYAG